MGSQKTVAVIGAGLIGRSWAALLACHGHDVVVWDPVPPDHDEFHAFTDAARRQVRSLRKTAANIEEGRIRIGASLGEAVANAIWVQENAPESIEPKIRLYRQVEAATGPDTIVASSTSSLRWSELSPGFARPERFITAHPFNPPHLMPLVEIFAANDDVLQRALDFYQGLERETVVLARDATGHIANRLQSALWREAMNILQEGIADVGAIDRALVHGPGLRWSTVGACMASHLGGGSGGIRHYLEHLGPSQERRWASLGTPKLTAELCERLVDGVTAEANGRSIAELEAERDNRLMRVMMAREM